MYLVEIKTSSPHHKQHNKYLPFQKRQSWSWLLLCNPCTCFSQTPCDCLFLKVSSCCEESDLVSINLQPILFLIWHLVDSSPSYRVGVLPVNSPLPRPPSRRRSPDLAIDVMDEKDGAIIMNWYEYQCEIKRKSSNRQYFQKPKFEGWPLYCINILLDIWNFEITCQRNSESGYDLTNSGQILFVGCF